MSFRFVWGHVLKMPWTFHNTQSILKSKPLQYLNIHR
ncbi:hypothetical protein NC651_002582 [Populus alba x Populus x berolinensis]|uniref:Uncharacterized protein n=1 Tax=Populus alba x Populus x berolinensis TaxID=444605 RepID=A0AAD6RPV9_9ROSI|nr:hypothetical protein NC651_002582 [Populus alba x Populus x berolinensis]KAJ7012782.1 hypothetical protein NC653_002737 [Populus alba x Populus x berolinensis]